MVEYLTRHGSFSPNTASLSWSTKKKRMERQGAVEEEERKLCEHTDHPTHSLTRNDPRGRDPNATVPTRVA